MRSILRDAISNANLLLAFSIPDFYQPFCTGNERCNEYDGEEEYWVVLKESGKKTESTTYSETHQKEAEAHKVYTTCTFHEIALTFVASWFELQEYLKLKYPNIEASGDPTFDFGKDKFKMLEAAKTRIEAVPTENAKPNSKGGQVL